MRIWEEIIAEVKRDLFKNGVLGNTSAEFPFPPPLLQQAKRPTNNAVSAI
jgi:hypothetical protein